MEVLVHLMCDCASPRVACPECRDKESILRWLPLNLLPLLQRPYIVMDRRYVPSSRAGLSRSSNRSLTAVTDARAGY
jgi:hypothetical protein